MTDRTPLLDREVTVLVRRLRARTPHGRRAEAAHALAVRLAELGRAPAAVPRLDDHVLADQVAVTGHDLIAQSPPPDVVDQALELVADTRAALGA